ncbi:MAG: helix-turn-helix domain-containing protein [Oscillospiraceae bacterium]|nr:helix-turn-helix domain-containing protein [Oscillospiraceae bacterium]
MQDGIFQSRLTEQRKLKKISQKQAAKDLGISQALLSHYENGIRECGLSFVVRAANYYGVTCDYLLGNSNSTIQVEAQSQISDIAEDMEMSAETIVRASIIATSHMAKDPELMEYIIKMYGLATYFAVYGGIKRGVIPREWLPIESRNIDRVSFLASTISSTIRDLESLPGKPKKEKVPASVATVNTWVNDYLNIYVAKLI